MNKAFTEVKAKCKVYGKTETFLRDYIYRGGIPVVNSKRYDYYLSKENTDNPEIKYFCKRLNS